MINGAFYFSREAAKIAKTVKILLEFIRVLRGFACNIFFNQPKSSRWHIPWQQPFLPPQYNHPN